MRALGELSAALQTYIDRWRIKPPGEGAASDVG
jgi:hypothetical protein